LRDGSGDVLGGDYRGAGTGRDLTRKSIVRLKSILLWGLVFVLFYAILFIAENAIGPTFRQCVNKMAFYYGKNDAGFIWAQNVCTLSLIDRHNGFFSLLGTGAVACFTLALWRSTDRLWESGEKQIASAGRASEAALRSVAISESALKDIERAFIYCSNQALVQPEPFSSESANYIVNIQWTNSGKTSTVECFQRVSWQTADTLLDESFTFPDLGGSAPGRTFIAPNGCINGGPLLIPHAYIAAAMEGRCYLYIWGWCEYDDIFPGTPRHRSEFCFRIAPVQSMSDGPDGKHRAVAAFMYHNKHNGADEDCSKPIQTVSRKNPLNSVVH
jgi:hypothetical protein